MKVRHPYWAGRFYPASEMLLQQEINSYLHMAPQLERVGPVVGLMAPHAGYVYSGRTAAAAYKQLSGQKYETVVVLSPSHAAQIEGVSAYDGDYYETPLGTIPVNRERVRELAQMVDNIHVGSVGHDAAGDRAEHALEVQLPFLQTVLDSFTLVPMVFHDYSWENCRKLGEALANGLDPDRDLIVASSDLYHGYSYTSCQETDARTLNAVVEKSAVDFCLGANREEYMACGAGPIAALKFVAESWNLQLPIIVAQTNSADVSGDKHGYVVGYGAAIWQKKE